MKTKYILSTFLTVLFAAAANAQVGYGTNQPDESAVIDMISAKRGVLVPRVALSNTTVAAPIVNPAESLLVYNLTNNAFVQPGFYYWSGGKWNRIAKIDDFVKGSITSTDLNISGGANATFGNVTLGIADGAVSNTKLAKDAVDSSKILNGSVAAVDVAPGAAKTVMSTDASGVVGWTSQSALATTVSNTIGAANVTGVPITTTVNGTSSTPVDIPMPWNRVTTTTTAISNNQDIYQMGKVGIGYGSGAGETLPANLVVRDITGSVGLGNPVAQFRTTGKGNSISLLAESGGTMLIGLNGSGSAIGEMTGSSRYIGFPSLVGADIQLMTGIATATPKALLTAKDNGFIGIGTITPAVSLDVSGQPAVTAALDGILAPRLTAAQLSAKTYGTAQNGAMVYVTDATVGTGQASNVNGVGLYTFNSPTNKWVKGGGATTVSNTIGAADVTGVPITTTVNGISSTPVDIPMPWNVAGGTITATANNQNIYQLGNVGIGTSNPTQVLDVQSNFPKISIKDISGLSNRGTILAGNGQKSWEFGTDRMIDGSDNFFIWQASKNEPRFFIDGLGNVGIGTVSPTTKLEIDSATLGNSGVKLTQLNDPLNSSNAFTPIGVDNSGTIVTIPVVRSKGLSIGNSISKNVSGNSAYKVYVSGSQSVNELFADEYTVVFSNDIQKVSVVQNGGLSSYFPVQYLRSAFRQTNSAILSPEHNIYIINFVISGGNSTITVTSNTNIEAVTLKVMSLW